MHQMKLYSPSFAYFGRVVRLLLQSKGLNYVLTQAPFGEEIAYFSDEHQQMHPFKKIPTLIDGDYVLNETLAIASYIDSFDGASFLLESPRDRANVLALASHLYSDVYQHIVRNLILEFAFPKGTNKSIRVDFINSHLKEAHASLEWIEKTLNIELNRAANTQALFFYGDQFTLPDAYLIPALDYLSQLPEPYNLIIDYPVTAGYLDKQRRQTHTEGVLGKPDLPN